MEGARDENISQKALLYLLRENTLSQQIQNVKVKWRKFVSGSPVFKTLPGTHAVSSRFGVLYKDLV